MKKINVILYEPEIYTNVGSIFRTCMLTNVKLHLIEPFGFIFDKRNFARSSANSFKDCEYEKYDDWNDFVQKHPNITLFCLTRYGKKPLSSFDFKTFKDDEIYLMFGKESSGIDKNILKENIDHCFRIPMIEKGRSLNLSNTVAISVYEVLRQLDYQGLSLVEVQKGSDYLDKL